ncbi:MAG TPA: hypothetical protein VGP70_23545 [Actinomadura sp.]|jgi:hypothetical protein|nr:hypothetical protein [Actinomadura sp.]
MTTEEQFRKAVLWAAIEDYSGLWEIVWELNTLDPEGAEKQHIQMSKAIVRDFLNRDWVQLFWCQEPYGGVTLIAEKEIGQVLADAASWMPPDPEAVSVRVSATDAGERMYDQLA